MAVNYQELQDGIYIRSWPNYRLFPNASWRSATVGATKMHWEEWLFIIGVSAMYIYAIKGFFAWLP